jgi:drug/metabolite transporter (DMT)-like permease
VTGVALLAMLGVALLWGSAFPLIKVGLADLSVPHLTVARHLVASLAFLPVLLLARARLRPERRDVPTFLALGFSGIFVYHTALNAGELRVSAGATSLVIATAPAITAALARLVHGERMPRGGWLGSALAFLGVALIALGDAAGLRIEPFAGFVLLAAVATSVYFVFQTELLRRYRPIEATAFVTWGGTVPMLAFLPGLAGGLADAGVAALAATAYIGLFPSAVAYSLFAFAQSRVPVGQVASFLYAVPVVALTLSWLLLGEVPRPLTLVGGVVAIAGIVVVQRARRRVRRAAAAG